MVLAIGLKCLFKEDIIIKFVLMNLIHIQHTGFRNSYPSVLLGRLLAFKFLRHVVYNLGRGRFEPRIISMLDCRVCNPHVWVQFITALMGITPIEWHFFIELSYDFLIGNNHAIQVSFGETKILIFPTTRFTG